MHLKHRRNPSQKSCHYTGNRSAASSWRHAEPLSPRHSSGEHRNCTVLFKPTARAKVSDSSPSLRYCGVLRVFETGLRLPRLAVRSDLSDSRGAHLLPFSQPVSVVLFLSLSADPSDFCSPLSKSQSANATQVPAMAALSWPVALRSPAVPAVRSAGARRASASKTSRRVRYFVRGPATRVRLLF